jgi:hypothetical protein
MRARTCSFRCRMVPVWALNSAIIDSWSLSMISTVRIFEPPGIRPCNWFVFRVCTTRCRHRPMSDRVGGRKHLLKRLMQQGFAPSLTTSRTRARSVLHDRHRPTGGRVGETATNSPTTPTTKWVRWTFLLERRARKSRPGPGRRPHRPPSGRTRPAGGRARRGASRRVRAFVIWTRPSVLMQCEQGGHTHTHTRTLTHTHIHPRRTPRMTSSVRRACGRRRGRWGNRESLPPSSRMRANFLLFAERGKPRAATVSSGEDELCITIHNNNHLNIIVIIRSSSPLSP